MNDIRPIQPDERHFVEGIKQLVEEARLKSYAAINAVMLDTYWNIGRRIVEHEQQGKSRADYGARLLSLLADELTATYGKGFSARNLRNFRQFYVLFPNEEIWHTRVPNLTWSHIRTLLRVTNEDARMWYLNEAAQQTWSVRTLDRNISSQYYHRLLQSPQKEAVVTEMKSLTAAYEQDKLEFIKNPIVAEFLGLAPNMDFTESKLESAILTHIQKFLMEMGKGYAFVARQQHISTDAGDYFIDLVFYNYILKCFLLIDLKTSQISHQDVGQMDMYVRMYDELKRTEGDNPTIGLILCSETSRDIARYSVLHENPQLFTAKYLTYLPSEEELRKEIEQQKEVFRLQQEE
ncbi:YhcG family protein [uncultured Alistipes sp.]|uniref:PDDEXK nuclease domain-containing protein n=1 Tax=uncultured Alistipes sp. TaxID=538949 RepID=UPI00272B5382|nr:PDDEXK nuclease domain-containing protein [uncultured Alistipes sp.]